ncbi:hypothetical protein [Vulcanisaeta distributa]|uniref:hypothetical protein n=1 Tax=Vulcanisaeta distributa TaxID=164451 RepID=UPI000B24FE8F|nr:hypothetical protein [Vulcanisaeta distributa]
MNRRIVVGKHSGKHSIIYILRSMGIEPRDDIVNAVLKRVKELGDMGIKASEEDIKRIIMELVNYGADKAGHY